MGHKAFLEAQNAMDVIVQRTSNVPGIVNDTYEILTEGDDQDLKDIPILLAAIKRNVDECKKAAEGVVTIFQGAYTCDVRKFLDFWTPVRFVTAKNSRNLPCLPVFWGTPSQCADFMCVCSQRKCETPSMS